MSNVTLDGNPPIELSGKFPPQPGDNVPPFTLTSSGLEEVKLDNWAGKRKILNIIPPASTPVYAPPAPASSTKRPAASTTP